MPTMDVRRVSELRNVFLSFINERRDEKLKSISPEHEHFDSKSKRFDPATWIGNAAKRVDEIQCVTHIVKPMHNKATGTEILVNPVDMQRHPFVGSHVLDSHCDLDVSGNAASLDVYKFLKLTYDGKSFLTLMQEQDADLKAALSDDPDQAQAWMTAFASITQDKGKLASHTMAKQLYWPVDEDQAGQTQYHLLAPLYASSLAHRVFETVKEDRFSDEAQAARQAKREGQFSERPVNEYPQMAVQKLGGTKPQNISQLNSERRGENLLLASLPPLWQLREVSPLVRSQSLFNRFGRRSEVKTLVRKLLVVLKSDPKSNIDTRTYRDELVEDLLDELMAFAAAFRELPPGWSRPATCLLSTAEKHWLDPEGLQAALDEINAPWPDDSAEQLANAFALWLNQQLRDPLPMGEPEFQRWREQALTQLRAQDWEVLHVH